MRPTDVAELEAGDPREVALENALRKARAAVSSGVDHHNEAEVEGDGYAEILLGVDTLVTIDGEIYGKPTDEAHARRTLGALGGRAHEVLSGVALLEGAEERTAVVSTTVHFRELDRALLDWYLATGEWRGRAGGYAIQGAGAALVRSVEGDYENVVGLPLASLLDLHPGLLGACK